MKFLQKYFSFFFLISKRAMDEMIYMKYRLLFFLFFTLVRLFVIAIHLVGVKRFMHVYKVGDRANWRL